MKKKIVVLLMASALALSACGSDSSNTTTTTAETTTAIAETSEETSDAEDAETSEVDDTTDAETVAGESTVADLSALESVDMDAYADAVAQVAENMTIEQDGDSVKITYAADLFAGLDADAVEAQLNATGLGTVTQNDDGSFTVEFSMEDYEANFGPLE